MSPSVINVAKYLNPPRRWKTKWDDLNGSVTERHPQSKQLSQEFHKYFPGGIRCACVRFRNVDSLMDVEEVVEENDLKKTVAQRRRK